MKTVPVEGCSTQGATVHDAATDDPRMPNDDLVGDQAITRDEYDAQQVDA